MGLKEDLQKCVADTHQSLGARTANTIKHIPNLVDEQEMIESIGRIIKNRNNAGNGVMLRGDGGLSLEEIVIKYEDKFPESTIKVAKQNLGI